MELIQKSAEHHFLTFLEKLKKDAGGWLGLRLAFSSQTDHGTIIEKPSHIKGKLSKLRKESDTMVVELDEKAREFNQAILYQFNDSDLVLFACPDNEGQRKSFTALQNEIKKENESLKSEIINVAKDIHMLQKLADKKFLAAKRMDAYEMMSDDNKVASIEIRRKRHEDAVVLMVEDDRFTASYAANILNKDYDLVVAKTGEEAILLYIEHCPDMVFLDIHLPGLDGHDTLDALKKIDPDAHIVMLSVDAVKSNIVSATESGAAGFLKKPFTKDRILSIVEKSPHVKSVKSRSSVR